MLTNKNVGKKIFLLIKELSLIRRTLACAGNRKTLKKIKSFIPILKIIKFKTNKKVFDWKIPYEWEVKRAYIKFNNKKIINYKNNPLHLVGYSKSIRKKFKYNELINYLHTKPDLPNAIPYVTSYYKKNWGFCITHNQLNKLKKNEKKYEVLIDSTFKKGTLDVGEIYIPGKIKKEIVLSTNICHPNMINNELCGPSILTYIAKYFLKKKNKMNLSIRIVFFPETIGSIAYINKKIDELKNNFYAGYHITCFGDKGPFSLVTSKYDNSISDIAAKKLLRNKKNKRIYSFKNCGSDERQYNYPGVNLPVTTLTRSLFGKYKQYHTSLDNFNIISIKSLADSFNFLKKIINEINADIKINDKVLNAKYLSNIEEFEKKYNKKVKKDFTIKSLTICEPFLTKRKLFRTTSKNTLDTNEQNMFNLLYYGDNLKLSTISNYLKQPMNKLYKIAKNLEKHKLIKIKQIIF
jgi:aminopeptidase-like protein